MPKPRKPSPARSQGGVVTPRRQKTRGSRSLCSPALSTASGRLTSLIDQFKDKNMESFALSPLNGRSVLNDNTDIEEPRRKSWWKKLDENSQDVMEVLEDNKVTDANNMIEEFIEIEVLSQEKKNHTLDLPESSDNESINSIVLPQRRLFTQKENQPQKKFSQLVGNRDTLAKLHKTNTTHIDKTINVGTKELFQNTKRSKPVFPAALLNISPNKTTADKTKENIVPEPRPQVRNIFGNRPANKRKNMFVDFIVSESEDEIPDIQPKVFGFQKKPEQRRFSAVSKGRDASPTSSITTDMEMDDWKLLPSSTMVENQLEDMVAGYTPVKRARLSKLSEAKESEAGTNTIQTNTTVDKTKQSNKSASSKNKSKSSPEVREKSLNNSRITRSVTKKISKHDDSASRKDDTKNSKSQNKIVAKNNDLDVNTSKLKESDKQNTTLSNKQNVSGTRNSSKIIESETKKVNVTVNNKTRVINRSTTKNLSNTVGTNEINEVNMEVVEQNDQDDDENNFTLEYENDDDERVEEAAVRDHQTPENIKTQHTTVLKKDDRKQTDSNKSLQKPAKTVEASMKSQPNEQFSANDNVDGNFERGLEPETDQTHVSEVEEKGSQEIPEQESESETIKNIVNESDDNQEEAIEKSGDEVNISHENDDQDESRDEEAVNLTHEENEEDEDEANESDENDDEQSRDVDTEANESQEVEAKASESSEAEDDDVPDQDESEEINDDEEAANESHIHEDEVNESQETEDEANESEVVENVSQENDNEDDSHEHESEVDANESIASEEVDDNQQTNDSDEADKAIASDAELTEDDDNQDEMEVDDENEEVDDDNEEVDDGNEVDDENEEIDDQNEELDIDESEQNQEVSHANHNENNHEIEPSAEEIEESPNVTHDTTGRNRKKEHSNRSPELIRHDKTNQMNSFAAHGRNTSVRKTKSLINHLVNIKPSLAPPRDSTGFSDGTRNSSAEGSGWDSHRTTRKTLRQTFGKDFTPRKSLRTLVMEKSAKRQTEQMDTHSETVKFPQANSTEFPDDSNRCVEDIPQSDHEISRNTRQTTLEMYLQKMKQQDIEKKLKMEEAIRNSLKAPVRETLSLFKVPNKPAPRRPKPVQSKARKQTPRIPLDLPSEVIEDMKYKPPKRFQPSNASWTTKRLYKYLESKLEPKYDYKARVRAEKLVETIYHFAKDLRRHTVAPAHAVEVLKHELARLEIVNTHFEFYEFFHEFMPREIRIKVVPDIVNKIPLPRHGVFSDILRGNTVQG